MILLAISQGHARVDTLYRVLAPDTLSQKFVENSSFTPTCKEFGGCHSHPHNKWKTEQIENKQLFLDP